MALAGIGGFLKERQDRNLLRVLRPIDKRYIDFSSNDYLGLSGHPKIKDASREALDRFGAGSCASRLLSGDLEIHHRLEEEVAVFKEKEKALVFNSGYQANVGIISALCSKGDVIFADRQIHASIIDGMLLSGARFFRFNHNDAEGLEAILKRQRDKYKEALIITETIFSMDGDRPPLKDITRLKERYGCALMADEAHATGIFGKRGSGVAEEEGLSGKIDLIMGTFGKALGSFGAYAAASTEIIDYLINTCRSFIYSTALPPAVIAANLAALDLIREEPERRRALLENAEYFRGELKGLGFEIRGSSQIVPLVIGDNERTVRLSEALGEKDYWVLPIREPTVPAGEARLRFSLTCNHSKNVLKKLIDDIAQIRGI